MTKEQLYEDFMVFINKIRALQLSEAELEVRYGGGAVFSEKENSEHFKLLQEFVNWGRTVEFPPEAWPKGSRVRKIRERRDTYSPIPIGAEGTIVGIQTWIPVGYKRVTSLKDELDIESMADYIAAHPDFFKMDEFFCYIVEFDGFMSEEDGPWQVTINDCKLEKI